MIKFYGIVLLVLMTVCVNGEEMRTWTSKTGKTIEGTYVSLAFENVRIENAEGELIKLPLDQLSETDQEYVEFLNPPELTIDYRESAQPREFTADPWYANGGGNQILNHPIHYMDATFGALVKQKSMKVYDHDLVVEMYILTEQNLDPDKFHIIGKVKSEPFRLNKANKFRYTYDTPQSFRIMYYDLYSQWPRGEKPSRYLILIRDERGEVIAHKSRGKWLYTYLDQLEKLPVGAWINDRCKRVHTTQPPRTRRDGR